MKKAIVILIIFSVLISIFGIMAGVIHLQQQQQENMPAPEFVTLTFKNVGYTYLVKNWDNSSRHYFEEGNYTITKGTEIEVFIEGTDYYRAGGFIVNNETIWKDHLWYDNDRPEKGYDGVTNDLLIEAIIVGTPLKKALDTFEANNITVVKIEDLWRSRGFSHTLMQVKFENIEGLIQVAQDKDIDTILWKRGREFKHGWVWDKWDYFIFLEGEYIYYRRQDI